MPWTGQHEYDTCSKTAYSKFTFLHTHTYSTTFFYAILFPRVCFFSIFLSRRLWVLYSVYVWGMRQKSSLRNSCYSTFSFDVIRCFCFVLLQNRTCHIVCFLMYTVQFPSYFLRVYKRVQKGYKRVKTKRVFFLSVQFTLL